MATSLRKTVTAEIGNFLLNNGFALANTAMNPIFREELVSIANSLSDYYEEGTHLYPEVLLTNNIDSVHSFMRLEFYNGILEPKVLSRAVKMCAPLCNDGWYIFMQVNNDGVKWGMINCEQKITSLSLFDQLRLSANDINHFVLIHNVGTKTVELKPVNGAETYVVSLSLNDFDEVQNDYLHNLCEIIGEQCHEDRFCEFLEKNLGYALQIGHGNLIAVIKEFPEMQIPTQLTEGVNLLNTPLDLYQYFHEYKQSESNLTAHEYLKKMISLLVAMLNHDGICLFTNSGKLIGYHYIVDNQVSAHEVFVGGARTKAYKKLCGIESIYAVLMKTQEGAIHFNKQNDETR